MTERPTGAREAELSRFTELAGTRLYRRNIFAVTGLSVRAKGPAVRRQRQRLEARLAVEQSWPGADGSPLAAAYGRDEVRAAFEEFQDPRRRLVDELLWLWGTEDLSCGCPEEVHEVHDAAVRFHARALEAELGELELSLAEREFLWGSAVQSWNSVLEREEFGAHLRHRVRALGDPRLGEESAEDFLERLPALLVSPFNSLVQQGEFISRVADQWSDCEPFEGPVLDLCEDLLSSAHGRITKGLLTAEDHRNAGRYDQSATILWEQVVPEYERLEHIRKLVASWRYEELGLVVAVGLNNLAVALQESYTYRAPSAHQREEMIELARKAHDVSPQRDEEQFLENWGTLVRQFGDGGRARANSRIGQGSTPYPSGTNAPAPVDPNFGKKFCSGALVVAVVLGLIWIYKGFVPAIIVAVVGLAVIGLFSP